MTGRTASRPLLTLRCASASSFLIDGEAVIARDDGTADFHALRSQRRGHEAVLYQSRHVACASSCMSMRTSLEEGIKLHRFAGIFPEQFLTEAGGHRKAVVAADQRMVIRCFRDDLTGFVHDVSHVPPPIQRAALLKLL